MDIQKRELWDRLENEPERAYRAFECFLGLPSGERTLLEAYRRHEAIVSPPFLETGMSDEEAQDAAMKQEYRDTLRRLGLIAPRKTGPEGITALGRLLLEYVDGPRSEWEDD
jgi:hypothetical protein